MAWQPRESKTDRWWKSLETAAGRAKSRPVKRWQTRTDNTNPRSALRRQNQKRAEKDPPPKQMQARSNQATRRPRSSSAVMCGLKDQENHSKALALTALNGILCAHKGLVGLTGREAHKREAPTLTTKSIADAEIEHRNPRTTRAETVIQIRRAENRKKSTNRKIAGVKTNPWT
jgi:hypothetical protein